jgi:hypothetical protein
MGGKRVTVLDENKLPVLYIAGGRTGQFEGVLRTPAAAWSVLMTLVSAVPMRAKYVYTFKSTMTHVITSRTASLDSPRAYSFKTSGRDSDQ